MELLKDYTETTKGIYRKVMASNFAYEIVVTNWAENKPLEKATGILLVTITSIEEGITVFSRQVLQINTVEECIKASRNRL